MLSVVFVVQDLLFVALVPLFRQSRLHPALHSLVQDACLLGIVVLCGEASRWFRAGTLPASEACLADIKSGMEGNDVRCVALAFINTHAQQASAASKAVQGKMSDVHCIG